MNRVSKRFVVNDLPCVCMAVATHHDNTSFHFSSELISIVAAEPFTPPLARHAQE